MIDTPATTSTQSPKETASQRIERIKRERPSWSILDDIRRYAQEGFGAIPDDDLTVRMRAWGLYTQGDGRGTRGDAVPYFMMRLRTPNGAMTAAHVRTIAEIADRHCRGVIDLTNRQNFQLHWVRIEDVPAIWDALESVGWTSMGACGDNTRTVTGCPLAGVAADEIINAEPLAITVDRAMNGNPEFANLPRKFKITITGCSHWCTYPEINDIGITAARRGNETGYHLRVGGGLSTRPHAAIRIDAFVREHQVLDVVKVIAGIFRDSDELRRNRARARMKFLFIGKTWNAETFLREIVRRIGYDLPPAGDETVPDGRIRDHVGIRPQRDQGMNYAGFSVLSGRITPDQLRAVASLADECGNGTVRATAMQNLVILNVPDTRVAEVAERARRAGLPLEGSVFQRGTLSCTGSEFCKLAITETKGFSIALAHDLERRMPGFGERLRIYVTGCPNSCGQHWIADIGLQGVMIPRESGDVEGFDVFCGGGVGENARFAHRVGYRVAATDAGDALERLCRAFDAERVGGEPFRSWSARVGDERIRAALAGQPES
jgi:sulfite reductase (ferredoxin)